MNNYFINPIWFYWINLFADIKTVGIIIIIVEIIGLGFIGFDCIGLRREEKIIKLLKNKAIIIITIIALFISIICPSKQTSIEIMIASIVTKENVDYTEDKIKDTIDYIIDKLDNNEKD